MFLSLSSLIILLKSIPVSLELRSVNKKHDSAFTGFWNGSSWNRDKLKTHEKHEQRMEANEQSNKFAQMCDKKIRSVEKVAKDNGIKLELPLETEESNDE